jgi:proteasome lid subunit RPN8/RPN11
MFSHAEDTYPLECCGFFLGEESDKRFIFRVLPVGNGKAGNQRRRFEIAPDDYRKAERYAEDHELDLLGVYHSHPDHPAVPSEHDRSVALPFFSYIIISVQEGETAAIRSWQLNEERTFEEESLEFTEVEIENPINQK